MASAWPTISSRAAALSLGCNESHHLDLVELCWRIMPRRIANLARLPRCESTAVRPSS